jgi:deoxyadenosine/deoxycytidine kinase
MHQFIVIEGPLGVGKTSLARMLAEEFNGQIVLEDVEGNPFLSNFYQDPKKYGFQTQIFFLLRRYQHAAEINQLGLFKRAVIADYLFDKDSIFARTNLNEDEFWLYENLFRILKKRVTPPDLVIFLQAKTEVLLERKKINQAFNDFFFHFDACPLLVVNASEIDFVHVPEDFGDLVEQIKKMKSGTQYYVPLSSRGSTH